MTDRPDPDFDETDDDLEDEFGFDCAAFWIDDAWFCPILGTEECDWECPGLPDEDGFSA